MVIVLSCGLWDTIREGQLLAVLILITFCIAWIFLVLYVLCEAPRVWLAEEGIWVCMFFRKRFYSWDEILQAGIVFRLFAKGERNWTCLLLPGGSPRKQKDRTFLLRNLGRIVWITDSPEVLACVEKYYGPWDFDLSATTRKESGTNKR